jgi:hypothetical protein
MTKIPLTPEEELVELKKQKKRDKRDLECFFVGILVGLAAVAVILLGKT